MIGNTLLSKKKPSLQTRDERGYTMSTENNPSTDDTTFDIWQKLDELQAGMGKHLEHI
jgi:hypothetical protein